jgi:hypothetical protein
MDNYEKIKKLLLKKPIKGNSKQLKEWRRKIKELRNEGERKHKEWVLKTERQWTKNEWFKMYDKLMKLSLKQLCDLTTKLGIIFVGGNDKIKDKKEFVLVLDEADKEKLLKEYKKAMKVVKK